MSPVRVICTCVSFGCAEKFVTTESGTLQPGKFAAASTRTSHRARDQARGESPDAPVCYGLHRIVSDPNLTLLAEPLCGVRLCC